MSQSDIRPIDIRPADFESRMRFGLNEVLTEHPELDAVRWCA